MFHHNENEIHFSQVKEAIMTTSKTTKVYYWVFTILLALPMLASGIGFLSALPPAVEAMHHLGYPPYLVRFLGAAKLLGTAAVLVGTFPRIKEWAYGGFVINLIGAAYSHLASGDGPKAIGPLVILSFCTLSYFYWRRSMSIQKLATHAAFQGSGIVAANS